MRTRHYLQLAGGWNRSGRNEFHLLYGSDARTQDKDEPLTSFAHPKGDSLHSRQIGGRQPNHHDTKKAHDVRKKSEAEKKHVMGRNTNTGQARLNLELFKMWHSLVETGKRQAVI